MLIRTTLIAATAAIVVISGSAFADEKKVATVLDDAALSRLVAGESLAINVAVAHDFYLVDHVIGVDDQIFRTISAAGDGSFTDITPATFTDSGGLGAMFVDSEGVNLSLKTPK